MKRIICLSGFVVMLLAAGPLPAQTSDAEAARDLGLTKEKGALPLWSKPSGNAHKDLGRVARSVESSVFLVGAPRYSHGTAWVLSKKNRLLVTNAHVADIMHDVGGKMFAISSGSSTAYKVEKVWYHPGLRRHLKDNRNASVRAMDPKEGAADIRSPDLAVIQLSSYGPDLPDEFPLATPAEVADLFAQPVGMIGFPAHDTKDFPQIGENANATFHDGVISRVTDFHFSTTVASGELQCIQHTIQSFGGFSGSPLFLPNGHVVAINNCGGGRVDRGTHVNLAWGARVDCLWELLVYHGLDSKVSAKFDKDKLLLARYRERDERDEKARANLAKARALIDEADVMIQGREDFKGGVDKCWEAIELAPGYAPAYQCRSTGLTNYWFRHSKSLSDEDAIVMLRSALKDAMKCQELMPSDPRATVSVCLCWINLGVVTGDKSEHQKAVKTLKALLAGASMSSRCRAAAHSNIGVALASLREFDDALWYHNEAVRLGSDMPALWSNRAAFFNYIGRPDLAADDHAKAKELREKLIEKK